MTRVRSSPASSRSPLVLALLAVLAAGISDPAAASAPTPEREPLPSEKDRWIHLESANFSIYSSAPERVARKLATRLERLRQVLARLGGERGLAHTRPTDIFVFKDERSWRPFRPLGPDGKPREIGGFFLPRSDRNSIALYDWADGDPVAPILHEYVHSLVDVTFAGMPVWANEGIADFYSTFVVSDDAADIGRPVRGHVQVLDGTTRMPTARLLAVSRDDPEYNEASRQTIFYAQSWFTAHFLLLGRPERRGDFGRYLAALEQGAEPMQAFVEQFGLTLEALDKELDARLRKRVYPFIAYRFDELPPLADFTVRAVPHPEALARLGDLKRRYGPAERPRGVELLEAARRLDPASPLPLLGLAFARSDDGDEAGAEALLREALALDPGLEPTQAALGSLLMRRSSGRAPEAARAAEARELLGRATATEPGRLDSWIGLGWAELAEGGDAKRAARAFEAAWRLAPERSDLVGSYALALAEDGQYARAAAIVRTALGKSSRASDRTTAQAYLKQIAEREVWALAGAGRLDDALARIEAHLAAGADPELAKNLNATKARILSELAGQRCYDDYNAGIRAANAQKFAEARPLFEKVVAECAATDAALVTNARETLEQITQFEKKRKR